MADGNGRYATKDRIWALIMAPFVLLEVEKDKILPGGPILLLCLWQWWKICVTQKPPVSLLASRAAPCSPTDGGWSLRRSLMSSIRTFTRPPLGIDVFIMLYSNFDSSVLLLTWLSPTLHLEDWSAFLTLHQGQICYLSVPTPEYLIWGGHIKCICAKHLARADKHKKRWARRTDRIDQMPEAKQSGNTGGLGRAGLITYY